MKNLTQIPGRLLEGEADLKALGDRSGHLFDTYPNLCGAFRININGYTMCIFARNGTDDPLWEHISVCIYQVPRCPTWEEMDELRKIFWDDRSLVVQYHPKKSEYVNTNPYMLHLWAIKKGCFPFPDFSIIRLPFDCHEPIAFSLDNKTCLLVRIGHTHDKQWEFASVNVVNQQRFPTWEEMCYAKKIVWTDPEDLAVQFHKDTMPYSLSMWKFNGKFPRPDPRQI